MIGKSFEATATVNEISGSIASDTEQLAGATDEIARNVQVAAAGAQDVSANINDARPASEAVATVAIDVAASAEKSNGFSRTLTDKNAKL